MHAYFRDDVSPGMPKEVSREYFFYHGHWGWVFLTPPRNTDVDPTHPQLIGESIFGENARASNRAICWQSALAEAVLSVVVASR